MVPSLVLEDGTVICESHAIVRYLAREFNLYGKTNKDRVINDQVLDTLTNILEICVKVFFFTKDPAEKVKNIFFGNFIYIYKYFT